MRTNLDGTKCGKPVRCIFDRREDLEFTSKRHPSLCTYKVAVKDGKVTAMDIDVKFNGGAYTTLPAMVDEVDRACGLRRRHKEYAQPLLSGQVPGRRLAEKYKPTDTRG